MWVHLQPLVVGVPLFFKVNPLHILQQEFNIKKLSTPTTTGCRCTHIHARKIIYMTFPCPKFFYSWGSNIGNPNPIHTEFVPGPTTGNPRSNRHFCFTWQKKWKIVAV